MTNVSRETADLLSREDCVLVVIDVQKILMPVILNKEKVVENVIRLIRFSNMIGLPIVVTEQERLGPTIPDVKKELVDIQPTSKVHFNCFFCNDFANRINNIGRNTLVLTGVEAHICVAQTALFALPRFNVHVINDAVSSRTAENRDTSIARMQQCGVTISSTEMFIYELLQKAGTDEFRAALRLVK